MGAPPLLTEARVGVRRVRQRARSYFLKLIHPHLTHAFSVESHLTTQERIILSRLAKGRKMICEIGSYIGASACCFGAALHDQDGGTILCIDTWNNDAMSEGNRNTHAEFTQNTAPYAHLIVQVRGFSTEVRDKVASHWNYLDLLFIDGDHSYSGVKADWDAYQSLLRPGSIVVFHDCGWAEGVQRVIQEEALPRVSKFNRVPNMWWGTIRA